MKSKPFFCAVKILIVGIVFGYGQIPNGNSRILLNGDSLVMRTNLKNGDVSIVRGQKKYYVFLNSIKTDSIEEFPGRYFLYQRDLPDYYFIDFVNEEYVFFRISGTTGKMSEMFKTKTKYFGFTNEGYLIGVDQNSYVEEDAKDEFGLVSGGMKKTNELLRTIVSYDLARNEKKTILKLDSLNQLDANEDVLDVFIAPRGSRILITTGLYESGEQNIDHVFDFEISKSILLERKPSAILNEFDEKYGKRFFSWSLNYYVGTDAPGQHLYINDYIFDSDFTVVGLSLIKDAGGTPMFFLKSNTNTPYVSSVLDRRKRNKPVKVFVPYDFDVSVEKAIYRIYKDELLVEREIRSINTEGLEILKNMLFAKHNYQFDSEYYQAIFNLFSFYDSEKLRKERSKDVNHLMTESDKKNLTLITKLIRKR